MANYKICRVCLIQDIKMYNFNEYNLKDIYEEILCEKVKDEFPQFFCYECAAMLYKFHKFKQKCLIGLNTFKGILIYQAITPTSISKVDRKRKNLQSSIDILNVNERVKDYVFQNESPNKTDIKEIDIKLEISDDEDVNDRKVNKKKHNNIVTILLNEENNTLSEVNNKSVANEEITDKLNNEIETVTITEDLNIKKEDPIQNDWDSLFSDSDSDINLKELVNISELDKLNPQATSSKVKSKTKVANTNKKSKVTNTKKVKTLKTKKIDKEGTETIKKKSLGGKKKRNIDPALWNMTTFNDEEALADFEAKAFDPKYLAFPFKCEMCFKGFSTKEKMTRHVKMVHCESRGSIVCKFCKQRFKYERELRRHTRIHYEVYKCQKCDYVCRSYGMLYPHEFIHSHNMIKCKHCDLKFRHTSSYYTHLRIYHRSEHVCSLCGESFVSEKGLKQHKLWTHMLEDSNQAEDDKPAYCEKCDIKFETQWAYNEHINRSAKHEGEFAMKEVQRDETNTNNDKKVKKRHQTTIIKCPSCSCIFRRSVDFVRHHNLEHKEVPLPPVVREVKSGSKNLHYRPRNKSPVPDNVMCEICGATLKGTSMASHMNARHTKEIIYNCSICKRGFTSETSRNRHQLVHTGEKPYKCTLCDTRFTQLGSMNLHYRRVHLKEPYPKRNRRKEKEAKWQKESELNTLT